MNVRVAVTGRIVIVTLIGSEPTATTPAGRASSTVTVSLADTPVIGIGTVSTRVRAASWSASPATSTTCGSTVTDSISKPAAGVPVMTGLTGSVRLWRSEKTGIDDAGRRRVDLERAEGVPELVDRHQLGVLVDVEAGRLDEDVGPGRDDLGRRPIPDPTP